MRKVRVDLPENGLPPSAYLRRRLTSPTFCIASKSLALPGMPNDLSDGDTARQIVFSVRLSSATTRFVVKGSRPRATHSTDA